MMKIKICPVCGKQFETKTDKKMYCGYYCKEKSKVIRYHENKEESEVSLSYNPNQELVNMAIAARNAGMSYGQYAGKLYLEKQKKNRMRRSVSK